MAPIFTFEEGDSERRGPKAVTVSLNPPLPRSWAAAAANSARPATKSALSTPQISRPRTPVALGSSAGLPEISVVEHSKMYGTAKGGLAQLIAGSQPSTRAPSEAGDIVSERANLSPAVTPKKKSKKGKKAKGRERGAGVNTAGLERPDFLLPKAIKLAQKVASKERNGGISPVIPDQEEEDWKFLKRSVSPAPSSRTSSPPRSGLSSLLSQVHPADRSVNSKSTSVTSEDGEAGEPTVSYEVALDHDYVDESRPPSRIGKLIGSHKKMTSDDFEPIKCLGKGAYGTVTLVQHKASGKLYAQKQLKKASLVIHKKVIEQTRTERDILESVRHPNVVRLSYAFQDHEKLYLILQYAQGGELFHHLAESRMFTEDTTSFYIAQLVLALSHLHRNGIVYRDLKPENCLLDEEGHLLLTDFGLSKVRADDERCCSFLGTPGYMAPEVLSGDGKEEYGAEVDWWGVGVLTFELLTGKLPFEGSTPEKVKERIRTRKLVLPPYLTVDSKDFVKKLLRKEPEKRLGYNLESDLPVMKKHRFFRKIDWNKLEQRDIEPPIRPLVTDPLLAENFSEEFTNLALSPVTGHGFDGWGRWRDDDPFGGFSFVATSLLEEHYLMDERRFRA